MGKIRKTNTNSRNLRTDTLINQYDPTTSNLLKIAWTQHCVPNVRRAYKSATKSYSMYCREIKVPPWPATDIKIAAWLIRISTNVKFTSMKMYLCGVRNHQLTLGYSWNCGKSERLYRTMRWIKRKFPCEITGLKFAISHSVLKAILPLLPGWPIFKRMSFDDLSFATASIIGTTGLLRGGEFLHRPNSDRPLLRKRDLSLSSIHNRSALVATIVQPKAKWWISSANVPIYGSGIRNDPFDPSTIWAHCKKRSPDPNDLNSPAFQMSDGSPLTQAWMTAKTKALCEAASISMQNEQGKLIPIKATSWRAGGTRSAQDAHIPDALIKFMGRWSSNAYMNYMLHTACDVQGAARRMWASPTIVGLNDGQGVIDQSSQSLEDMWIEETVRLAIPAALSSISDDQVNYMWSISSQGSKSNRS
jgi:hypothetical protein